MLNRLSENSLHEVFLHNIAPGICQIGQDYDAIYLLNLLRKTQENKSSVYSMRRETEAKGSYRDSQQWGKSKAGPVLENAR